MILVFRKFLINSLFVFLFPVTLISQNQLSEFRRDIFTNNYEISLSVNDADFYTGKITITDRKNNNEVFRADSIYSRFNWDTLIDLNRDGRTELILDLTTGPTMYDYNMFLIFDFSRDSIEPFEVHNAVLNTYLDPIPKIVSNVRLSPSALGAGYSFSLVYSEDKLILENDIYKSNVLKSLKKEDSEYLELIEEYRKVFNECGEDSDIKTYYESYIMQQKVLGQEDNGWQFFEKYYNCDDKEKIKMELKKSVQDDYGFWNTSEFKFGSEEN